jgi:hypothetical protein
VDENAPITAGTAPKITFDAKGLVTSGDSLDETDLPTGINANKIGTGVVSTTEFEYLNGVTSAIQTQIDGKQATLVSGTNIKTINSTSLLGSGDITISANPSGVSGAIQFSNGSAFASDAANLFWDDTNNRLGVGTNAPSATAHIGGVGSTLSTFSLLVRNSVNQGSLSVADDGVVLIGDTSAQGYQARLTFVRASGAGRSASFNQNNTDLIFTNPNGGFFVNGCLTTLKGSGSTSATTSLLVQNSAGAQMLKVADDGTISIGTTITANSIGLQNVGTINNSGAMKFDSGGEIGVIRFQGNQIGMGDNTTGHTSALLTLTSTTKGFLPPRMTTTQKNAIASPATGLVLYDSTTNKLQCYNGSTWNDLF